MLSPDERGKEAEKRFLEIFSKKSPMTPWWFRKISGASPSMDVRGVDAIAVVRDLEEVQDIKVPIQIKSSRAGTLNYLAKHPDAWFAGVVLVIVNDYYSDDEIREYVFQRLRVIHEKTIRYDDFYKKLFGSKLSPWAITLKTNAGTKQRTVNCPEQ